MTEESEVYRVEMGKPATDEQRESNLVDAVLFLSKLNNLLNIDHVNSVTLSVIQTAHDGGERIPEYGDAYPIADEILNLEDEIAWKVFVGLLSFRLGELPTEMLLGIPGYKRSQVSEFHHSVGFDYFGTLLETMQGLDDSEQ